MLRYEDESLKVAHREGHELKRKYEDLRTWEKEHKVQRSNVDEDWVRDEVMGCLAEVDHELLGGNEELNVRMDLSSGLSTDVT